jgi:glycosyltransferase involved in cell wall biosynthesis
VGRLIPDKGVDLVVDAVAALQRRDLPAQVTLLGSLWWYGQQNPFEDWFAGGVIAQTLRMGGYWYPHATRADTAATFRAHDVVCVLSRSQDPAPLVTLEAMASGCAVVATDRGGIRELAGDAAVIVPAGDVHGVVETLAVWCKDREELSRVKARSIQRAASLSWDHTVAEFLAALERR